MVALAVKPCVAVDDILPASILNRLTPVAPNRCWQGPEQPATAARAASSAEPELDPVAFHLCGAKAGDKDSIAYLSKLVLTSSYAKARRLGLQDAEAADVAQEVSISVSRHWDHIESPLHFKRYVLNATRNRAFSVMEVATRRPTPTLDEILDKQVSREGDPVEQVCDGELTEVHLRVVKCIERLPKTFRTAIELSMTGKSVEEICTELGGITAAVFYVRLSRARSRLKEDLMADTALAERLGLSGEP